MSNRWSLGPLTLRTLRSELRLVRTQPLLCALALTACGFETSGTDGSPEDGSVDAGAELPDGGLLGPDAANAGDGGGEADGGALDADAADAADANTVDPESDDDQDGVLAGEDNCPDVANAAQLDLDGDGIGDACDDDTAVCARGGASAARNRGNLYFLLDWSWSMRELDGGGSTRWQRVIQALDTVADQTVRDFNVGVAIFPSPAAIIANNNNACAAPEEVLTLEHYAQTPAAFRGSYATYDTPTIPSYTPTRLALSTLRARLQPGFTADPAKDAIVLLTDGSPNSSTAPSCTLSADEGGAVNEARALANIGVKVYVVGMANGVNASHLQDMANAGTPGFQNGDPDQPYYQATQASELSSAFQAIQSDAVVCTFDLAEEGGGSQANFDRIRVVLDRDGNPATLDNDSLLDPATYTLDGTTLSLSDSACAAFNNAIQEHSEAEIRVVVPCVGGGGDEDGGTCVETSEVCDGEDNDCDGLVDEGCDVIII